MERIFIPRLVEKLNGIAEAFDKKPIPVKAAEVWFDTLREFDIDLVLGVLGSWAKSHGKFPVPSEVWKACNDIAASEREKIQQQEKVALERAYTKVERTTHGSRVIKALLEASRKPKPKPLEHWQRTKETEGLPQIAYDFAEHCLKKLQPRRAA